MKLLIRYLPLFILLPLLSCEKYYETTGPDTGKDLMLTAEEQQKAAADNRFTLDLFREATAGIPGDQNALLSPLSASLVLAMTSNGARGETLEAMHRALRFEGFSPEMVNSYHQKLLANLPLLDPKTQLDIANSIWYRQGFSVLPAFLDINNKHYQATVEALDFAQPDALDRINGWVDAKTKGKIPEIIDQIPANAVMYLINAIYFKGDWEQKFDKSKTRKMHFHCASGKKLETDFMNVGHTFPVLRNQHVTGIELPYGNRKYSMVILLPADGTTPQDLIEALNQESGWETWASQFDTIKTNLWMPKFKFSYENKLNDELTQLGMSVAFNRQQADFTGINAGGNLFIDEVKHKSFIEVNEKGTEAAAVTSVGIVLTSAPQVYSLTVDRPFLFLIRGMSTGLILFMGQVNDPSAEENVAP